MTIKLTEPKNEKVKKKVVFAAAGISLFIHLTLFSLVGGVVVVEYAMKRAPMIGEVTPAVDGAQEVDDAPEPSSEPDSEIQTDATEVPSEPAPVVSATPVDVLTVNAPVSSFQIPMQMGGPAALASRAETTSSPTNAAAPKDKLKISNPFGNSDRLNNSSLEGFLYDLKETKSGRSSGMDPVKYVTVLTNFFKQGWDPKVLEQYHRVKKPLYTSQIYMPLMDASEAPRAFKVEKEVQPAEWVVLYQGTFQVPQTGFYRFAGYADDALAVKVDNEIVLDASRFTEGYDVETAKIPLVKVPGQEISSEPLSTGRVTYSKWLSLSSGKPNKIEILVGERPGGLFCAYLFIENKNKNYKKEASGRPILPIFRTADTDTPQSKGAAFDPDGPVFGVEAAP